MRSEMSWLTDVRGLCPELLTRLGVDQVQGKAGEEAARIPYRGLDGGEYGKKYRKAGEGLFEKTQSRFFFVPNGQVKRLWNVEILMDSSISELPVIICEGEIDAISVIQSGFVRCVSLPDGWTDGKDGEDPEFMKSKKMEPLISALPMILQSPYVIVANDNDSTGRSFVRALYNLLDGHEVRHTEWPQGCKDANDVLREHGEGVLAECLNSSKQVFPKGGLITGFTDLPPSPPTKLYRPKSGALSRQIVFQTGAISVFTGVPGHGKTTALIWLLDQVIKSQNIMVGGLFMETSAAEIEDQLSRMLMCKPSSELKSEERQMFKQELDNNWRLLHRDLTDVSYSLDWLYKMIRDAVNHHQCRIIVIDPWNELEHMPLQGESYTAYVNAALAAIRRWAELFDIHIVIVCHPKKIQHQDGTPRKATGYDCADSAAFYNKPALGMTIFNNEIDGCVEFIRWKCRQKELYRAPIDRTKMSFDPARRLYREI